jgi:ABC-type transporter Mla MlaB component
LPRPRPEPSTSVLVIGSRVALADVPCLCGRVRASLEQRRGDVVVCDVGAVRSPDAVTVDVLARLQLTARRLGGRILLRDAPPGLQDLLDFVGLSDAVPVAGALPVGRGRQPEEREHARGVEERVDGDDAIA